MNLQSYILRNEWLVFCIKKWQTTPKNNKAETEPGFNTSFPLTVLLIGLFPLHNQISTRKLFFSVIIDREKKKSFYSWLRLGIEHFLIFPLKGTALVYRMKLNECWCEMYKANNTIFTEVFSDGALWDFLKYCLPFDLYMC